VLEISLKPVDKTDSDDLMEEPQCGSNSKGRSNYSREGENDFIHIFLILVLCLGLNRIKESSANMTGGNMIQMRETLLSVKRLITAFTTIEMSPQKMRSLKNSFIFYFASVR